MLTKLDGGLFTRSHRKNLTDAARLQREYPKESAPARTRARSPDSAPRVSHTAAAASPGYSPPPNNSPTWDLSLAGHENAPKCAGKTHQSRFSASPGPPALPG